VSLRLVLQVGALAAVAGLLALLVWRVVTQNDASRFVSDIADGKAPAARAFSLPAIWQGEGRAAQNVRRALADERLSLDELRGMPVVLNFWASWCGPCEDEAPLLAAAAIEHEDVAVVGIDVKDLTDDARVFLRENRIPYASVRDGDSSIYDSYGLTGVPETYFVDARGRAVAHVPGPVDGASLDEGIAAARG
jgi:cytochrome c biogenesis protein CcmG/thiol:disulfide interchange protein DsbE